MIFLLVKEEKGVDRECISKKERLKA